MNRLRARRRTFFRGEPLWFFSAGQVERARAATTVLSIGRRRPRLRSRVVSSRRFLSGARPGARSTRVRLRGFKTTVCLENEAFLGVNQSFETLQAADPAAAVFRGGAPKNRRNRGVRRVRP